MDATKDYYATLGLTPSADDVVIRAAYKALAQRYHPDRSQQPPAVAHARMAEINEAYKVLGDPTLRAKYDKLRGSKPQNADTAFQEDSDASVAKTPLDDDWRTATEFYPELVELEKRLSAISKRLSESFRARILETKNFSGAKFLAQKLETEFLKMYFGETDSLLTFARMLILDGHKHAAHDLNKAIRVFGDKLEPARLISTLCEKHRLPLRQRIVSGRMHIAVEDYAHWTGKEPLDLVRAIYYRELMGSLTDGTWYMELDMAGEPVLWGFSGKRVSESPIRLSYLALMLGIPVLLVILTLLLGT